MSRLHADSPVWAGVAVRFADGRIIAVEIDHPRGEIEVTAEEQDITTGFNTFRRVMGVNQRVTVDLSGPLSRGWQMGQQYAAGTAIENPRPAIAAGPTDLTSATPAQLPSAPAAESAPTSRSSR